MKKPVTKYALREIVRNGTVHPQIVFTVTAQEIADLSRNTPRIRPSLVLADANTPQAMAVMGLNNGNLSNAALKAEKDLTLAYMIFAKRAMKHNHTVKVLAWHGAPDDYEERLEDDDLVKNGGNLSPGEMFTFAPREFRKNIRIPAALAAQKFYQRILPQTAAGAEAPAGCSTLKIFSRPRA